MGCSIPFWFEIRDVFYPADLFTMCVIYVCVFFSPSARPVPFETPGFCQEPVGQRRCRRAQVSEVRYESLRERLPHQGASPVGALFFHLAIGYSRRFRAVFIERYALFLAGVWLVCRWRKPSLLMLLAVYIFFASAYRLGPARITNRAKSPDRVDFARWAASKEWRASYHLLHWVLYVSVFTFYLSKNSFFCHTCRPLGVRVIYPERALLHRNGRTTCAKLLFR